MSAFELHPQLQQDCLHVGDFSLSRLLLAKDANYPWFILVPRIAAISEIYQLSPQLQQQLCCESSELGAQLMQVFAGDKLNIAALGNMVPQLHIHHIVRYKNDLAWPAPIWGASTARERSAAELAAITAAIGKLQLAKLQLTAQFNMQP